MVTHVAKKDLHPLSINDISGNVGQIRYTSDILFIHNIIFMNLRMIKVDFVFKNNINNLKEKIRKISSNFTHIN